MNGYKNVIKSLETRRRILSALSFVPDEPMIRLQYRIKCGRWPDLKNPERFSEKIQWYKLHYRDPLMARCVDKYDVRGYVEECGLGDRLVPLVGVYDSAEDVDFSVLPERFVLKDTLGGGSNDVVICTDRAAFDEGAARADMRRWTTPGRHRRSPGREWVYDREGPSRIVCEKYLEPVDPVHGHTEYKIFCFDGEPRYIQLVSDLKLGQDAEYAHYRADGFRKLDVWRVGERRLERDVERAVFYDEILDAARTLSAPFPEVRVDIYDLGERGFRIGELTFFTGSGYTVFEPDEFDFELGGGFTLREWPEPPAGGIGRPHELQGRHKEQGDEN